jgi:hypothetical protein
MRVLLIAETNWLENIVLAQDSASVYLMGLARTGEIEIAVPEYSFHEADGSLNRKHSQPPLLDPNGSRKGLERASG